MRKKTPRLVDRRRRLTSLLDGLPAGAGVADLLKQKGLSDAHAAGWQIVQKLDELAALPDKDKRQLERLLLLSPAEGFVNGAHLRQSEFVRAIKVIARRHHLALGIIGLRPPQYELFRPGRLRPSRGRGDPGSEDRPADASELAPGPSDVALMPRNMDIERDFKAAVRRTFANMSDADVDAYISEGERRDDAARRARAYPNLTATNPDEPIRYRDRPPGMKLIEFLRREYLAKGVLARPGFNRLSIKEFDEPLYQAIVDHTQKKSLPADIDIPKVRQRVNKREAALRGPRRGH